MSEAPSWLTEDKDAGSPAMQTVSVDTPAPVASPAPAAAPGGSMSASATAVDPDDKELPGIILAMRLANMGVSIALMTCSVSDSMILQLVTW